MCRHRQHKVRENVHLSVFFSSPVFTKNSSVDIRIRQRAASIRTELYSEALEGGGFH